ncbi:MATE family efflux transporter [Sneathiella chinensis]|uniref:MATE family efflux transporter n=1 Tax=Sneathiella chinensis TaxID=349750 RepID=A0ABQ5U945_9PROT|nr:MATE family efflux transporter [Sneathiella chinensis]GLQ07705.1 MATE family efflux transporter [Sneathiella chinensis]
MNSLFHSATHREVLWLAWPIILSNLSVPLLGAVDTAVVGHLPGPQYLGAVAIGAMIFSFLYWGFGFLRMGTTGFVAQAAGAENSDEIRTVLARALILGGGLAVLILLCQVPVLAAALYLVEGSEAVEAGATAYFSIRVWGAPAVLANYAFLGFFIGLGNTRAALMTQVFMNAVNICLDLIFVLGLDMGVPGVAFATVLAEYSAVLLGAYLVRRELLMIGGRWLKQAILSLSDMKQLLAVNLDIFVRTILLIFSFAYFTAQAAKMGEETLAAMAVLMNFVHFLSFGLDGFAHAAEGLVGRAVGRGQPDRLNQVVGISSFWAGAVALLYAGIYAVFGPDFINLLTSVSGVRDVANDYLIWVVVMPLVAVWPYQLDGVFIGAMQSREMRNGMILSFAAYFAALHVFSSFWGAHGLWAGLVVFMVMRGLTLTWVYPRVLKRARGMA